MNISKPIVFVLALGCFASLNAKHKDTAGFYELSQTEKRIAPWAADFIVGATDLEREHAAWAMFRTLETLLNIPASYNFPFDSLKTKSVSILQSAEGQFKLYTFNLILKNGSFKHFGYLQVKDGNEILLYPLLDTAKKHKADLTETELETTEWYGALYYSITPFKVKRKKMFLLLGYNGADVHSNKKVIDVLWFDRGTPVFGKNIFLNGAYDRKPAARVIFEFHNESGMVLRYENDRKIIVLDNLAPAFPEAVNDFPYYIPTGDLDYYQLNKYGYWVKDAMDNYNLGQGKNPPKVKPLPKPEPVEDQDDRPKQENPEEQDGG